jgi:cellulose biosynthesis protein BcsQ
MRVAVCGIKGGVSKTTVAIGLAAEGVARGLKVLLVDGDAQGR